jgi:hypothetical protein
MESSLSTCQAICINPGEVLFNKPFHCRVFVIGAPHLIVLFQRQSVLQKIDLPLTLR